MNRKVVSLVGLLLSPIVGAAWLVVGVYLLGLYSANAGLRLLALLADAIEPTEEPASAGEED